MEEENVLCNVKQYVWVCLSQLGPLFIFCFSCTVHFGKEGMVQPSGDWPLTPYNLLDWFIYFFLQDILKSGSHLLKKTFFLLRWKPFKYDEKCFLFHLKSSFPFRDIYIFVLTFWTCRIKLTTSQPVYQTIAIHMLPISYEGKATRQ